jgi:hypothetical protein
MLIWPIVLSIEQILELPLVYLIHLPHTAFETQIHVRSTYKHKRDWRKNKKTHYPEFLIFQFERKILCATVNLEWL